MRDCDIRKANAGDVSLANEEGKQVIGSCIKGWTFSESERSMKKTAFLVGSLALAVWAIAGLSGQQASGDGAGEAAAKEDGADVAAIKKAGDSFLKAYVAGDAKKMAAHWTENGEYFADDGTTIRGRSEIEKAYTDLFAKKKGASDG